jgi:hypothetical protein
MLESRIYRIEEFFLAERFVQKGYRAGFEGARAGIVICVRGDEDDRDSPVGRNHLTLEIESVHAGHSHVENQACRIARLIRTQKRVRRRETLRPKSDRSDQIVKRTPKGVVIVDNRNELNSGHAASISPRWFSFRKRLHSKGRNKPPPSDSSNIIVR